MRSLAVAVSFAALLLVPAGRAMADCVAPPPIGDVLATAPVVFVGTVVALDGDDRHAIVDPEQVWAGPELAGPIVVDGAYDDQIDVYTSIDRTFQLGARYLFVPTSAAPPFDDDNCSSTQLMTPEIEQFAPAGATMIVPPAPERRRPPSPLVVLLPVAVPLAAWVALHLRRRPDVEVDGFKRRDDGPPVDG